MNNEKYLQELAAEVRKAGEAERKLQEAELKKANVDDLTVARSPVIALRKARSKVALGKTESTTDRINAIERNVESIGKQMAYAKKMIALVGNPNENAEVRHAALTSLLTADFSAPNRLEWRPLLIETLRMVAQEKDGPLVVRAMEFLAQNRYEWAMERLEQGLRKAEEPLVSPIEAIYFLAYNDHGQHYDVLREVAASDRNAGMRVAAIMHLGGDPEAKPILVDIAKDREERTSVREAALLSLRALSPADYDQICEAIVESYSEDDDLKATCITTLRVAGKYEGEVRKKVELCKESPSEVVRAAANLYLSDE
jgi:hypothetical protein